MFRVIRVQLHTKVNKSSRESKKLAPYEYTYLIHNQDHKTFKL